MSFGNGIRRTATVIGLLTSLTLFPGAASPQTSGTIDLKGHLLLPSSNLNLDVWGWVDPSTQTEYALAGNGFFMYIVDVSDPTDPTVLSSINVRAHFDLKVWGHHVYSVDGNYSHAGGPGKITDISDPANPDSVGTIPAGHNIFIDGRGYMYLSFPGIKIFDLNPNPVNPQPVWSNLDTEGHDVTVVGNRMYAFSGFDGTLIYDVTDPAEPVLLGSVTDPSIVYHHSGWTSEDERYLFLNDEFSLHPSPDITVWDLIDPASPVRVAEIADSTSSVHNSYRIGKYLYVAYYTAGFRVYDIDDPTNPALSAEYDTSPLTGENDFRGSWGCYPFSSSGYIYISNRPEGFFVFSFTPPPSPVKKKTWGELKALFED